MRPRFGILIAVIVAALLAPLAASASVTLRNVDATGYPTIRATVVAPVASRNAPTLTENGRPVVDLNAYNLSAAKSVVVAIDRSQSMKGKRLQDAIFKDTILHDRDTTLFLVRDVDEHLFFHSSDLRRSHQLPFCACRACLALEWIGMLDVGSPSPNTTLQGSLCPKV